MSSTRTTTSHPRQSPGVPDLAHERPSLGKTRQLVATRQMPPLRREVAAAEGIPPVRAVGLDLPTQGTLSQYPDLAGHFARTITQAAVWMDSAQLVSSTPAVSSIPILGRSAASLATGGATTMCITAERPPVMACMEFMCLRVPILRVRRPFAIPTRACLHFQKEHVLNCLPLRMCLRTPTPFHPMSYKI